jgi:polyhydroxyalkanoate synthesis regulator phasin
MKHTANHSVPEQGKFRRTLAAVGAWLDALEHTSYDYTQDRIDRLERKVAGLTEELRQSRASSPRESEPQ